MRQIVSLVRGGSPLSHVCSAVPRAQSLPSSRTFMRRLLRPFAALAETSLPAPQHEEDFRTRQAYTAAEQQRHVASRTGLDSCMKLLADIRSSSSSGVKQPEVPADVLDVLRKHMRPSRDYWLVLMCGTWKNHPLEWTGPAMSLLQLWPVGPLQCGYHLWMVDSTGVPTGDMYWSCSEMEELTSRGGRRKYLASCSVLGFDSERPNRAQAGCMALKTWLDLTFGDNTKLERRPSPLVPNGSMRKFLEEGGMPLVAAKAAAESRILASNACFRSCSRDKTRLKRTPKERSAAMRKLAAARRNTLPNETQRLADARISSYAGAGALQAGVAAALALQMADKAAAGPPPVYIWPELAPEPRSSKLHGNMSAAEIVMRERIIHSIEEGIEDMSNTHVPLAAFIAQRTAGSTLAGQQQYTPSAADLAALQVYRIEDLQRRAEVASALRLAGDPVGPDWLAIVPDSTRPFTLTMRNGKDGHDYVVAHFEPEALVYGASSKAALLCEIFHSRNRHLWMQRASAPPKQPMVMAGMRMPKKGTGLFTHYGRYVGDTGPEPDAFSLSSWPDLHTTGGFRPISQHWINALPGVVCSNSIEAAKAAREGYVSPNQLTFRNRPWKGPPANFPAPTLLGSPFTTLAVTHNFVSNLHAEPKEHPFSYITWHDVLGPGSEMEVGYFWLTAGLAFLPRRGSALYIDTRLVTHCSDACVVRNPSSPLEGRYGAALFIKPGVMKHNAQLWADFDQNLQKTADEFQQTRSQQVGAGLDSRLAQYTTAGDDDAYDAEYLAPGVPAKSTGRSAATAAVDVYSAHDAAHYAR